MGRNMTKLKPTLSDWVNFLIHKRKSLDEITNNIWKSYYAERTINLAIITILSTSILALAGLYHQIGSIETRESINFIPLLSAFLSGIDIVFIVRFIQMRQLVMDAIMKLTPFRYPLDEMLLKLMHGKYKNIDELEEEYESKLKPLKDILSEMSKKILK